MRTIEAEFSFGSAKLALRAVLVLALCTSASPGTGLAASDEFPSRPLRLIVPFPAGSSADLVGRTIAQRLSKQMGQTVVVDNRAGAGGVIGQDAVARSPSDGYTLGLATVSTLAVARTTDLKLPYDPNASFEPVSLVAEGAFVVVVHPSVQATTLPELIQVAKTHPGELNYYSIGSGTLHYFAGEEFKRLAGVDIVHVPYKGSAAALIGLLAGEVQVGFDLLSSFRVQNIESGKLKAIAVAGPSRLPQLPAVPTTSEAGLDRFRVNAWFGIVAPRGVPLERIQSLNKEIQIAVASPDVTEVLTAQGLRPVSSSAPEFRTFIRKEVMKWSESAKVTAHGR